MWIFVCMCDVMWEGITHLEVGVSIDSHFTPNLTSLWGEREKGREGYEKGEWKKNMEMREEKKKKRENRGGEQEKGRKALDKPQQHASPRDWVCR